MSPKTPTHPTTSQLLQEFGARLKLARLRRGWASQVLAEKAGISRPTLQNIEKGAGGVSLGLYLEVMAVFGFDDELNILAQADAEGRALQDAQLPQRASRKASRSY